MKVCVADAAATLNLPQAGKEGNMRRGGERHSTKVYKELEKSNNNFVWVVKSFIVLL